MMNRIQFTLCGSYEDDEGLNPYAVTKPEIRQEILSLINRKLLSLERLAEVLNLSEDTVAGHLQALKRAGLTEMVDSGWKPSFSIFTVQDQERLAPLLKEMAECLAKVVEENIHIVHKTHAACSFDDHGFSLVDLAYILVGAYILDFGALTLERSDFLVAQKDMPGGAYVFAGFEGKLRNLQSNWMWGHTASFGSFMFLGHGELPSTGPRRAFPDQSYLWRRDGWTEQQIASTMQQIGAILVALYDTPSGVRELAQRVNAGPEELADQLRLLQELEYVVENGTWRSRSPVVDHAVRLEIHAMVEEVWNQLLNRAVKPNWQALERLYEGTSPARNGIDICEAFNPIHHAIFDQALRLLMENGIIAFPPRHADGARYAVWI